MFELPVFILNEEHGIPLPSTEFLAEIPLDELDQPEYIACSGVLNSPQEKILLAVGRTNPEEPTNHNVYHIGVVATLLSEEQSSHYNYLSFLVNDRAYIRTISLSEEGLHAKCEYVMEELLQEEDNLAIHMKDTFNTITTDSSKLPKHFINSIKKQTTLVGKMNAAASILFKEKHERLSYLTLEDNFERWYMITEKIKHLNSLTDKISKVVPSKSKKKTPPPAPDDLYSLNKIPEDHRSAVAKELEKLDSLPKKSTEYPMVKEYVDNVFSIPWNTYTQTNPDLADFRNKLDQTHYGLPDVKDHLLEHMVIEHLKGSAHGTVLAFVGPPGTGKTTIAREIAAASNRAFQKISLGGLSDEAVLKGFRRTYVSSKPGRFVTALQKAKSMDPLIVLDEIDKMSPKRGSPVSVLLEVLDPEQNTTFEDTYLEIGVDLSKVLFICTANDEKDIPEPLRDRMEIIYFRKYTKEERLVICEKFLIPKIMADYNIKDIDISFDDQVIDSVCNIENIRQVNKLCSKLIRMAAVQIYVHKKDSQLIDQDFASPVFDSGAKSYTSRTKVGF